MRFNRILIWALPVVMLASCKDFLDVKPKTQIDADVAFDDEQGFMDALTGVYLNMSVDALYGKELSYGLLDVLGQQHTRFVSTFHEYYDASFYRYTNDSVRRKTDGIYKAMYKTLANDNNLIANLATVNRRMFRDSNYAIINGEAHALRAFMHFDLLRLFGPSPAAPGGGATKAIPYMDVLTVDALPRLTVAEVLTRIQADLTIAAAALKTADPIVTGSVAPTSTYLRERYYKVNYYAVKALQARVYLYAGDKVNALAAAREVIGSGVFTFTPEPEMRSGNNVFTQELVFTFFKADMAAITTNYFTPGGNSLLTKNSDNEFKEVYEGTNDYRYVRITELQDSSSLLRLSTKLQQSAGTSAAYLRKLPIIRVSEMYYIAAECLKTTDPAAAVEYLNIVRRARNITADLSAGLTEAQLQNEIFKEYRKDLYLEGQLFYYYKRLNLPQIGAVNANNTIYVLPLPDSEVEYGNGK
ncbi:RagB/SusD family nutrient uptake outer membrane protein [Chitinophaga horti]|uniref:RagB/SusD family nutrient uptake outer membrane protein n=1 Tax=Chitinophaga horti TaxID=2920382 RepID=A0ABY6J828_9BACT|nr:RagB/SusD family nutrient uptake outer membrane protein [Chitinophaga horti]UYQ95843.1 RagB/SusD family nutrient uptake outer membrane protein [Chitinophaga horti]